jgi:hypothetical protein
MKKCNSCGIALLGKNFISGIWLHFQQDGYFEILDQEDVECDSFYCVPCFHEHDCYDKKSLKHLKDCPLVKLRIACDNCEYPISESRYLSIEHYYETH